jgi:hypothetical protein
MMVFYSCIICCHCFFSIVIITPKDKPYPAHTCVSSLKKFLWCSFTTCRCTDPSLTVYLFTCFGGSGVWTQGLMLANQVLYHLRHISRAGVDFDSKLSKLTLFCWCDILPVVLEFCCASFSKWLWALLAKWPCFQVSLCWHKHLGQWTSRSQCFRFRRAAQRCVDWGLCLWCSKTKFQRCLLSQMAWINLEDVIVSEISQSQKDKHCKNPLMWGILNIQTHGSREYSSSGQELMAANGELFNGYKSSVMLDECILEICCTTQCLQLTTYYCTLWK